MSATTATRIAERCQACGISPIRLALQLGESRDAVRDIIRGKSKNPSAALILRIARALETTPDYLMGLSETISAPPPGVTQSVQEPSTPDHIPLYEPVSGHGVRVVVIGGTPARYIPRPPELSAVRAAFAMRVADDNMAPKYEPGAIVYVAAGRPPRRGQGCVIETATGARLCRYVSMDDQTLTAETLNPLQNIHIPAADVEALHAVLGSWEA